MKLLIVTQKMDINDPILGFFHRWVEEFAKHFEFIIVICLYKGEHTLPPNVRVLSLGKEDGVSRLKYLTRFYKYIWTERNNYNAVFVHMNQIYVILGGIFWRLFKKRVALWYTHKNVTISLRIAAQLAHTIFTASRESFRLPNKKVRVVGHGIDVEHFLFKEHKFDHDRKLKVLTIGRISPAKDYETLINAIDIVVKQFPDIHLDIIGSVVLSSQKKYLESLREKVEKKQLNSAVTFQGAVSHCNIVSLLHGSDLFINMSHTGSLDKAVLEAMAAGVPVLTSNEAFKDILGHEKLIFRSGDPLHLAQKIKAIALHELNPDTKKLRRMIEEKHNLKSLTETMANIFKNEKASQ